MSFKIVSDSSSNVLKIDDVNFSSVPLHILVGDKQFIDDESLDTSEMQKALNEYKGKTSTSCPSPDDWKSAFGDADTVFCITITSQLSGSNGTANIAKQLYEKENPGKTVYVIDSLSTGPEMALIIDKLRELILSGMSGEKIYEEIISYMKHTHLYYSLASVHNLARNGRVNPILAKGLGILGIRIVATASPEGTIQTLDKCRGEKKAIKRFIEHMEEKGYTNGKIVIAHNMNESGALELRDRIIEKFGSFNGYIHKTTGLCSYYAEPESILIGFEA